MLRIGEMFGLLRNLPFPPDRFLVAGSAPLLISGVKNFIGDLDIVVAPEVWESIEETYEVERGPYDEARVIALCDGRVEILDRWFSGPPLQWSFEDLFDDAQFVKGYFFLSLARTRQWKEFLGREKDLEDLNLLERSGLGQ